MMPILLISESTKQIHNFIEEKFGSKDYYCIYLKPQSTEYSINQIREIVKEVYIYQPKLRIFVFEKFDRSSLEAQNSFLKLLEEPPENIAIILTSINTQAFIPTILSRVRIVNVMKKKLYELDNELSVHKNLIVQTPLSLLNDSSFITSTKDDALKLLLQLILLFRERLPTDKYSTRILKEILSTRSLLDRNNLNPQLTIDHLLIFIAKQYSIKIVHRV